MLSQCGFPPRSFGEPGPEGQARQGHSGHHNGYAPAYGALDLGTNNCRLLVARPSRRGFQVIDAFSRIIRLGEGVSQTGRLSEAAMARTLEALKVCSEKMERRNVQRLCFIHNGGTLLPPS